jgi:Ca2+-binding RTX toxin-like protein
VVRESQAFVYDGYGEDKIDARVEDGGPGGHSYIDGGGGDDAIEVWDMAGSMVCGGSGNDNIFVIGDTHYSVYGDGGDDLLLLNVDLGAEMFGGSGNDRWKIYAGDSRQHGGDGNDILGGT